MEFWDLFVLQWHGVLLSAGAFGGDSGASSSFSGRVFCCRQARQVLLLLVRFPPNTIVLKPPTTIVFYTVSEVTLGILPCNSGTCSSFSGMVFCCRQVLLVVRRLTSSSSRAASCRQVLLLLVRSTRRSRR